MRLMPPPIRVEDVRARLAFRPVQQLSPSGASAAVTMLLEEREGDTSILLIHRAERRGDPWSGHMAFPGGFREPSESDLFHTAVRETREEVGIDIERHGERIGVLDDVRAASHRPVDLIIRPYVCALTAEVSLCPQAKEVQQAVWIPLAALERPETKSVYRRGLGGHESEFPAFMYRGFTIWGLTYRMLSTLLALVREEH